MKSAENLGDYDLMLAKRWKEVKILGGKKLAEEGTCHVDVMTSFSTFKDFISEKMLPGLVVLCDISMKRKSRY